MPRNEIACWCEALKLVPRHWRAEFTRFVEEGEASEEFLVFLDGDEPCRRACEMTLRADEEMRALIAVAAGESEPQPLGGCVHD